MSKQVCQYFLRGQCRFGESCRNEHPADKRPAVFGNTSSSWTKSGASSGNVSFSAEMLSKDTQGEKPIWPLSSYGPSKYEPTLSLPFDESFEELRFKAFQAKESNQANEYMTYEKDKTSQANSYYAAMAAKISDVYEHAKKQTTLGGTQNPVTTPSPFDPNATNTTSFANTAFGGSSSGAFGNSGSTSAFGGSGGSSVFGGGGFGQSANPAFHKTSVFGQPAFGQNTSAPAASAFGQPSQLGQSSSVFGQAAQPTSAFGKAAQPASAFGQSSFGQPSQPGAFGQPSQPTPTFGQPSQPTSAFGQPPQPTSTFGQTSQATSAFGQASTLPSVFGQTSQPASAFGQTAFGKPSAFGAATSSTLPGAGGGSGFSAFAGQPAAFSASTPVGAFGQPASDQMAQPSPSAFGQPSTQNAFGQPSLNSAFAQPAPAQPSAFVQATPTSMFGQTAQAPVSAFNQPPPVPVSAFGQPPPSSAFGPAAPSAFGSSASLPPKPRAASGQPNFEALRQSTKGQPDVYDSMLPEGYLALLPEKVRLAFEAPSFEWGGIIPDWIPPIELR